MSIIGTEENILDVYIKDVLIKNAKDYYAEILCHRAIPDGRDGLTEIQRRIIFTCYDNKWDSSKLHVKSARVIGDVVGKL